MIYIDDGAVCYTARHMKHPLLALSLLAVPTMAFALDFSESSARYADSSSFTRGERAGISVLTNLGAVSGNPDGTYAAGRTLNRAEFLKIVLKSAPVQDFLDGDKSNCFPDVKTADWFSMYVCAAKRKGMVSGYPDGSFKPSNPVNYAEAIKMLTELYGYELPQPSPTERWAWYTAYVRAATDRGVLFSDDLPYDTLLTRGRMAQLAAAYRTEHDGDLPAYRAWESGQASSSSRSSANSASSVSASSVSSVSSSAVSSSSSSVASSVASSSSIAALFPATSHFLVSGELSPVIMDGTFTQLDEDGVLRRIVVLLRREVKSFDTLSFVNAAGTEIANLSLATSDNTDKRRFEFIVTDDRLTLAKDSSAVLGIRANMRPRDNGGVSNELVEVENYYIETQGKTTGNTRQIVPTNTHYPMHQTTYGNILSVRNLMSGGSLQAGTDRRIASFSIVGHSATGVTLNISSLEFIVQKANVTASRIRIGGAAALEQQDCGLEQTDILRIACTVIPDSFKTIGSAPRTISIYADLAVSGDSGSLQLLFEGRGKIGQNGAMRWNDGSSTFNWIEATVPLENGPAWTVTK